MLLANLFLGLDIGQELGPITRSIWSFDKSSKVKKMDHLENSLKESSRYLSFSKFKSGSVIAIVLIVVFCTCYTLRKPKLCQKLGSSYRKSCIIDNLYEDVSNIGGFSSRKIWVAINQEDADFAMKEVSKLCMSNLSISGIMKLLEALTIVHMRLCHGMHAKIYHVRGLRHVQIHQWSQEQRKRAASRRIFMNKLQSSQLFCHVQCHRSVMFVLSKVCHLSRQSCTGYRHCHM
ncbi:hypothetical protein L7F22_034072 [Adiantum nelumboides]|nr:hypothetical protein [Adiantum nelumboides]